MAVNQTVKELEKKYEKIQQSVMEIEAQRKVNEKQLVALEAEIKKKTGLNDLAKLDEFIDRLEKEINVKQSRIAELVSDLESKLATLKLEEKEYVNVSETSSEEVLDSLEEDLDAI